MTDAKSSPALTPARPREAKRPSAVARGLLLAAAGAGMLAMLGLLAPAASAAGEDAAPFTPDELEPLLQSLQDEGLPRPLLNDVFYDDRLRKTRTAVTLNSVNPDSAALYAQFSERYAIMLAKRFKRKHFDALERAEQEYGVPGNVITAVLLVETQFGTYPLRYRVLEVYTTLVVDANHDAIDRHFERIKTDYPDLERDYFAQRITTKAQWAYAELVALLNMGAPDPKRLYEIKGSYAGAFGMPQFLPSSYLRWAVDGNGDGHVDINDTADAIASIANYLREHGWVPGAGLEQKMRAVWLYNRSPHYVDAIFEISRRMKLPPRKRAMARETLTASANNGEPG